MIEGWVYVLVLAATLGCAVMLGIFFAFSNFVMQALRRLPSAAGIGAMQAINTAIVTPLFVLALLGTAASCVVLAVVSATRLDEGDAPLVLAASLAYLVGAMAVTIGYHIPRNQALDQLDPAAARSASHWEGYVGPWVRWNHVRTVASFSAVALFLVALGA